MKRISLDFISFIKKRKIFLVLLFISILIFGLGIKQIINQKIKKESTANILKARRELYQKELEKYPEFKDFLKILENKEFEQQEKQLYQFLQAEFLSTGGKKIETELQLIKDIDPLIKNININESKSDFEYANEFKKEIEKLKLVNLNFNDKNNLALSGEFIYNIAVNLANIKPSKNYYQFHRVEVLLLGMMGKALIKLSNTNNYDEAIALSLILNNLADLQEKILKQL